MLFQKAALQDVPEISRMVVQAQRWFAENGIDQWQNGYPNEESVRKDIAAGSGVLPVSYTHLAGAYFRLYGGSGEGLLAEKP